MLFYVKNNSTTTNKKLSAHHLQQLKAN